MAKKRREEEEKEANNERWLLTYSDMITLLLVLFIVMYTMSTVNSAKFKAMAEQMGQAFGGTIDLPKIGMPPGKTKGTGGSAETPHPTASSTQGNATVKDQFQKVYQLLKQNVAAKGYQNKIIIDRGDSFILIRFKDSVLFYSDSAKMRADGVVILKYISDTLVSINSLIKKIQIEGNTAMIGPDDKYKLFAWQLSADRAIAVLTYMVQKSELTQDKMTIAGFSHYNPIASNATEAGQAMNRRVDVKITQVDEK
jgi:chemotaxis protein MotB